MKSFKKSKANHHRQGNAQTKRANDDDNCSVICYKDSTDSHVGVIRIRQQIKCSACDLTRGTLSSYQKHLIDNHHRENVKKLCDENRFKPSIYDQAIHLAFDNHVHYQSESFHFRYENHSDEIDAVNNRNEKYPNNQEMSKTSKKRRFHRVTLIFQNRRYTKIGMASSQIREDLLREMLNERSEDLAKISNEFYYAKKKIPSDDKHQHAQKSFVISSSLVKDDSQITLKNQQSQFPTPFEQSRSSSEMKIDENGVEQKSAAMTTDEMMTMKSLDPSEQTSFADDVTNVCKDVLDRMLTEIHSNGDQLKREMKFFSLIARRNFRKKNTFVCDICSTFLTSEKYCLQHLNSQEHLNNAINCEKILLPWRREMQKAIFHGKTLKETMNEQNYDQYKQTMSIYLAPDSFSQRGRFCCAHCELIFSDQWSLEKHIHSDIHRNREKTADSVDHKDLVVRFANVSTVPSIFKFNGVTELSQIPNDIKTRNHWRIITREKLDDETRQFLRHFPFDELDGATSIGAKTKTEQKSTKQTSSSNGNRFQRNKTNNSRPKHSPTTSSSMKRPIGQNPMPPNKRFRADLNNNFPMANQNRNSPWPIRPLIEPRNSFQHSNLRSTPFEHFETNFHRPTFSKPQPLLPTPPTPLFNRQTNLENSRPFNNVSRTPLMSTAVNTFNGNSYFPSNNATMRAFTDHRTSIGNLRPLMSAHNPLSPPSCPNFNPNSFGRPAPPLLDLPQRNFDRFSHQNSNDMWNSRFQAINKPPVDSTYSFPINNSRSIPNNYDIRGHTAPSHYFHRS